MNEFSLIEKLDILMKLISSSSLFLVVSLIGIAFLIFFVICIIKNKKINKWFIVCTGLVVGIIILVNYGNIIFKLFDAIIDAVFKALYFPNLPIYVSVLLIINISFIMSIINKKEKKSKKIINLISTTILDFLFVLIISVVNKNNINIYDEINLYTNSTLLVLLELSTGIFVSWMLVSLFASAHYKLQKYDKKEYPEMQEIIFD